MSRFREIDERREFFGSHYTRGDAERAVKTALLALEFRYNSDVQLADLADAIDALRAGTFGVAVALAIGALRRRKVEGALRPRDSLRSIPKLKDMFARAVDDLERRRIRRD